MANERHDTEHDHPEADTKQLLEKIFSALKKPVHVFLFTQRGKNDTFNDLAQQVLGWFDNITDKIAIESLPLSHKLAKKWKVHHSPTIVFEPDLYNIHWLGAPYGEEGRTFVELMILLGIGKSNLSEDSQNILKKIEESRHIKVFVSPTCPYCPQQAVNAIKAVVAAPDRISLEIIDIQAFPEIADKYEAHSVPQTFAEDILIAMGAQQEELFMLSLDQLSQQSIYIPESEAPEVDTDLVIIGGGPAGLTAGIYASRSGIGSVVLERSILGGQVATTPIVENYPGMSQVGGKSLADIMVSHALQYVQIFQGEEVMDVERNGKFTLTTNRRKFYTRAILLATGAVYRKLNVPGETRLSGRGVSYCSTCDGPLFRGKSVIMVGGGDSAATDALHLKNIGVEVTIAHWLSELEAQHHLKKQLYDNNIPILFNTEVKEIHGDRIVEGVTLLNNKSGEKSTLPVGGVFIAIGYEPSTDLAQKLGVELTPYGYIKVDNYRTSIPGVYAAGDVTGGYNQIVIASGQGSGAALTIFEDLIHPYWKETSKGKSAAEGKAV